jgi:hypothetical protein
MPNLHWDRTTVQNKNYKILKQAKQFSLAFSNQDLFQSTVLLALSLKIRPTRNKFIQSADTFDTHDINYR